MCTLEDLGIEPRTKYLNIGKNVQTATCPSVKQCKQRAVASATNLNMRRVKLLEMMDKTTFAMFLQVWL